MARPLPRNHARLEPVRRPKLHCVRGHLLRRLGWVLSTCTGRDGVVRRTRRCKACLRQDVEKHKRGRAMMRGEDMHRVPSKRNERTSARVARIAGRILAANDVDWLTITEQRKDFCEDRYISPADIRALAASALTQTADKKPFTSLSQVRKAVRKLRPVVVKRKRARRK